MDLQVKKLKVDISTTHRQNSLSPVLSSPQGRDKLHMKTYFKMYCFNSIFSKHVTEECTFFWNVLLVNLDQKTGRYNY